MIHGIHSKSFSSPENFTGDLCSDIYATSVTRCRTFNRDKYENVYAYDDFDDEIKRPTAQTPNKFYHYNNCYYSVEIS